MCHYNRIVIIRYCDFFLILISCFNVFYRVTAFKQAQTVYKIYFDIFLHTLYYTDFIIILFFRLTFKNFILQAFIYMLVNLVLVTNHWDIIILQLHLPIPTLNPGKLRRGAATWVAEPTVLLSSTVVILSNKI